MNVIEGFPGYVITDDGRVYSIRCKKFIKPKPGRKKYLRVELYIKGRRYHRWIHRLVCHHFVGNVDGKHVHHLDGNELNNRWWNLKPLTLIQHIEAHRKLRAEKLKRDMEKNKEGVPF